MLTVKIDLHNPRGDNPCIRAVNAVAQGAGGGNASTLFTKDQMFERKVIAGSATELVSNRMSTGKKMAVPFAGSAYFSDQPHRCRMYIDYHGLARFGCADAIGKTYKHKAHKNVTRGNQVNGARCSALVSVIWSGGVM